MVFYTKDKHKRGENLKLKDLELERDDILNVQQKFYDKLIEKIKGYQIELNSYKQKLNLSNEKINILKTELEIEKKEIKEKEEIIKNLNYEIIKLEDEIYQLKYNDTNNKIEVIDDLKEAFIQNDDEEIEEIIDEILENIVEIEKNIEFENTVFLMYMCYFTDRLKILLSKSQVANLIYTGDFNESKLLNILVQEENSKVYSIIEDCTRSYISKEIDLFSKLEKEVAEKIKETLEDFSYRSFEEVYNSNKINQGDKVVTTKAWVRHKERMSWKLVNGLYSLSNDKLYLEENVIEILGLREGKLQVKDTKKTNFNQRELPKENNIITSNEDNKYNIKYITYLYTELLKYFNESDLKSSLLLFNKIIEYKNDLNQLTNVQAITLRFIGYLINKSDFGLDKIKIDKNIGIVPEGIIYEKMISKLYFNDFLEENKNNLIFIDPIVRENIIKSLYKVSSDSKRVELSKGNNEDFDVGNLNTESDIKKLGYSTSLSREERWNILNNKVIPRIGKRKVIGHIKFLIKMNQGREIMANAVKEWRYDLERLCRI